MEQVEHSFLPPHLDERVSSSQKNAGQPIWIEWAGCETKFVDGFAKLVQTKAAWCILRE